MSPAETFYAATGANFFLTLEDRSGITKYLADQGLLGGGEELLDVRLAGEGNMNLTLRLRTNQNSYILKQSRPYVEKYPQVAAPVERSLTEAAFLQRVSQVTELADFTPRLLHLDEKNFTLFMQDLGDGGDLTTAYQKDQELSPATLELLVDYLSDLHGLTVANFPANLPLRRLNHEHLAVFPYLAAAATGFDPDDVVPGLADVAREVRADAALRAAAEATGRAYLDSGPCLLHGDFYPGSWLEVDGATYVIDAEFAHPGRPEYDLGVMVAHLHFARVADEKIGQLRARYQAPADFEPRLVNHFAGLELIRRLIGLAQLPLDADLAQRKTWLALGRQYLLSAIGLSALLLLWACELPLSNADAPATTIPEESEVQAYWYYQDTSLTETVLYDKILGSLVGSAIGDALGAPTEMWRRGQIEEEYGYVDSFNIVLREPSAEGPWGRNLPPGAGTDDTRWKELTIDYLVTQDRYPLSTQDFSDFVNDRYATQLTDLKETAGLEPEPYTAAIRRFEWLQEWARVTRAYSAGSIDGYRDALNRFYGGEMSCAGMLYAPTVGAYFPGKPAAAYAAMHDLALFDLGYARDISALGAALTALAFRETMTTDSLKQYLITVDPEGYFDSRLLSRLAYQQFQRAERIVRAVNKIDSTWMTNRDLRTAPPDFDDTPLAYARTQEAYRLLDENVQNIPFHAGEIYLVSLTAMLLYDLDFQRAIEFIVNYGRDNDTSAAFVGSILGAYHGADALPPEQRALVVRVNREVLNLDLEELAQKLTEHVLARRE